MIRNSIFVLILFGVLFAKKNHVHRNGSFVAAILYTDDDLPYLISTLKRFHNILDNKWTIQIFLNDKKFEKSKKTVESEFLSSRIERKIIMNQAGQDFKNDRNSINKYLVLNTVFWRSMHGRTILIFQADAVLCSKSPHKLDEFIHYDYIGASWPSKYLPGPNETYSDIELNETQFQGGNGGLSIRSQKAMIQCSIAARKDYPYEEDEPEDMYFSRCLKFYLKNVTLPTPAVQINFAVEQFGAALFDLYQPLGCHKCWYYLDDQQFEKLVEHCPEAKQAKQEHKEFLPMPKLR